MHFNKFFIYLAALTSIVFLLSCGQSSPQGDSIPNRSNPGNSPSAEGNDSEDDSLTTDPSIMPQDPKNPLNKPANKSEDDSLTIDPSTMPQDPKNPINKPANKTVIGINKPNNSTQPQSPSPSISPIKPAQNIPAQGSSYGQICQALVNDKADNVPAFALNNLESRFLSAHNKDRARFGLKPFTWSNELAQYAQKWADYLKNSYGCAMHHRSALNQTEGKRLGENLGWNWTSQNMNPGSFASTPEKQVYGWNSECADYDLESNTCKAGKQCGHFTQALWDTTQKVGCGVAICNAGDPGFDRGGRAEIWVCNYDPPGNITMIDQNNVATKLKPFKFNAAENKPNEANQNNAQDDSLAGLNIVLYGNPGCGLCVASEKLLQENNIAFSFVNIHNDPALAQKYRPKIDGIRYPFIYINGTYRGGYPELQKALSDKIDLKQMPELQGN